MNLEIKILKKLFLNLNSHQQNQELQPKLWKHSPFLIISFNQHPITLENKIQKSTSSRISPSSFIQNIKNQEQYLIHYLISPPQNHISRQLHHNPKPYLISSFIFYNHQIKPIWTNLSSTNLFSIKKFQIQTFSLLHPSNPNSNCTHKLWTLILIPLLNFKPYLFLILMYDSTYLDFGTNSSNSYYLHPNENLSIILVMHLLDHKNHNS